MARLSLSLVLVALALSSAAAAAAPKVKLEVYYEALCPACQDLTSNGLSQMWAAPGVKDIVDLTLVPYGNAKESQAPAGSYSYACQHGPEECVGNFIQNCAIATWGTAVAYPFMFCLESEEVKGSDPATAAATCAKAKGLDLTPVSACAKPNSQGISLMHAASQKTGALSPAHQYVPWVVLNGQHTDAIQDSVQNSALAAVCGAYTGVKPAGCPSSGAILKIAKDLKTFQARPAHARTCPADPLGAPFQVRQA